VSYTLHIGDCREVLRGLAAGSVDSIVCDPPYGLSREPDMAEVLRHWLAGDDYKHSGGGFMGKGWDSFVPGPAVWREAFRVLKPGGHVLAFSGTRTYDMAVLAMRLAGFEIRDQLAWVYGSGMPKSLDVSKAIDKMGPPGQAPFAEFAEHYEERRRASGLTHAAVCAAGGWHGAINHGGSSANWANGYGMPTSEQWRVLQPLLNLDERWSERVARVQYEREVLGIKHGTRLAIAPGQVNDRSATELGITAPASEAAKQWDGWGTALKPAWEPIVMARKPLIGTVAANVLAHGTGGLNIDGCRIEVTDAAYARNCSGDRGHAGTRARDETGSTNIRTGGGSAGDGRWPANLLHDGSEEVLAHFPAETGASAPVRGTEPTAASVGLITGERDRVPGAFHADAGSTARFFYCGKASTAEREAGLEGLPDRILARSNLAQTAEAAGATVGKAGGAYNVARVRKNHHPTVKPIAVGRWLQRLVTPPGGVTLDLYAGSGTFGVSAILEGFHPILIELDRDADETRLGYEEIIRARCAWAVQQRELERLAALQAAREHAAQAAQHHLFAEA
jgi:DNA modification methylase